MVILVKPQFEVGKGQVGKGGIVREPELHREACARVEDAVRRLDSRRASWKAPSSARKGTRNSCSMPDIKTVGIISKPGVDGRGRAGPETDRLAAASVALRSATTTRPRPMLAGATGNRASRFRKAPTW